MVEGGAGHSAGVVRTTLCGMAAFDMSLDAVGLAPLDYEITLSLTPERLAGAGMLFQAKSIVGLLRGTRSSRCLTSWTTPTTPVGYTEGPTLLLTAYICSPQHSSCAMQALVPHRAMQPVLIRVARGIRSPGRGTSRERQFTTNPTRL